MKIEGVVRFWISIFDNMDRKNLYFYLIEIDEKRMDLVIEPFDFKKIQADSILMNASKNCLIFWEKNKSIFFTSTFDHTNKVFSKTISNELHHEILSVVFNNDDILIKLRDRIISFNPFNRIIEKETKTKDSSEWIVGNKIICFYENFKLKTKAIDDLFKEESIDDGIIFEGANMITSNFILSENDKLMLVESNQKFHLFDLTKMKLLDQINLQQNVKKILITEKYICMNYSSRLLCFKINI